MNDTELDGKDGAKTFAKEPNRVTRCAQGAGVMEREVNELLKQYTKFAQVIFSFKGYKNSRHLKLLQTRELVQKSNFQCQYCPDQKTTKEELERHEVNIHEMVNTEGVPQDLQNNEFNISERETRNQKASNTFCLLVCSLLFVFLDIFKEGMQICILRPSKRYQQVQSHPGALICLDLT